MILPNKNIKLSYSLIGIGSILLNELSRAKTLNALWEKVKKYNEVNNFEKFILTLDLLFILNLITQENGLIRRVENAKIS